MTVHLLLLPILFTLSGFFSASETALFSMGREDRDWLRRRGTRGARSVLELLTQPNSLLTTVLFGNLVINFLLMAVCARLVTDIGQGQEGALAYVIGGLVTTVAVVVLGEVTPKAVAVSSPRRVALFTGPLLLAFRNATRLVTTPLGQAVSAVLDLVERRLPPSPGALTDRELKLFVELHGAEGALEHQAAEFLAEALELGSRRVHEVMTPRVDLVALDLSQPAETARSEFLELVQTQRVGKVLVHRGEGLDAIDGYLRTRDVLREADRPLTELVRPMWFVPSTQSLESLLREMVTREDPLALVVDEFGGTHGLVTLEDLIEEITGDIAREDASPLLRPAEDGRWVIAGRFPLREAEELLGLKFAEGSTTLSGFVAQQLGRIPSVGDVLWHGGVQFKVASMERRRANEIVVALPRPGRLAPRDEVSEAMTHSGAQRANLRLQAWVEDSQPTELSASQELEAPPPQPGDVP